MYTQVYYIFYIYSDIHQGIKRPARAVRSAVWVGVAGLGLSALGQMVWPWDTHISGS